MIFGGSLAFMLVRAVGAGGVCHVSTMVLMTEPNAVVRDGTNAAVRFELCRFGCE